MVKAKNGLVYELENLLRTKQVAHLMKIVSYLAVKNAAKINDELICHFNYAGIT